MIQGKSLSPSGEGLRATINGKYKTEGVKMKRFTAIGITLLILLGSFTVLMSVEDDVEAAPTRVVWRFFKGWIVGINETNPDGIPTVYGLNVTGTYLGNGTTTSPFLADINNTNGNYSVRVDAQFHDTNFPWEFHLDDCYGWNEAGGGLVSVPHPSNWDPLNTTNYTAPGILFYEKGTFSNISITILNATPQTPLEGVSFSFEKHPFHNTVQTGNVTDPAGEVLFNDLQYGIDLNDQVKIFISKENFTYDEGYGVGVTLINITEGNTTTVTLNITENDLVRSSAPAVGNNMDLPVDKNQVPNYVFVQFFNDMDQTSVNEDTLYLREKGGDKVDITYNWPTSDLCKIQPSEDLDHNTTYEVIVTPRVANTTGWEPLWRTFNFEFTTELSPATLRCQVHINGTMDPAPEGTQIRLNSNLPETLENGYFEFDGVLPTVGGHTIEIIGPKVGDLDEYLYYGNEISGILVERGQILDVFGLIVIKRETKTAIIEVLDEDGNKLEGANVTHQITKESKFTGVDGRATFTDVLVDMNTGFKASFDNYLEWPVTVPKGNDDPTIVNVTLYEKELPLTIKARSDYTIDLVPGIHIPVESKIQIDFENEDGFSLDMDEDTLTTDSLKIYDSNHDEVPIDISTPGDLSRWNVEPRSLLKYSSEYTLFISEQVASTGGVNPLWRDFTMIFNTETLSPSLVSGRITVREKGVEGVRVEVLRDGVPIASADSGFNGNYYITVDHFDFTMRNISVQADGSEMGLKTELFGPIELNAGGSRNFTDFDLSRSEDWFQVLYPVDDEGRMPVEGSITLKFKTVIDDHDPVEFVKNFTLTSPSVDLNITLTDGGKTVIINPEVLLDHDKKYTLSISDFQDGDFEREMVDVNGTPALIRGEQIEITTEFKPIDVILQTPSSANLVSVSVDTPVILFFTNYSVDPAKIEAAFEFKESLSGTPVGNLTFIWSNNNKNVEVGHDTLDGTTEYVVLLPSGKYGAGASVGAMTSSDFLAYFTTEMRLIDNTFDTNWPSQSNVGGRLVTTWENTLGIQIRIVILIEEERGSNNYTEYQDFTMTAGETDRQVTLNIDELPVGEYMAMVRIYDPSNMLLLNEYSRNIRVDKDSNPGGEDLLWVFVIIAIIVVLVSILAVYLISQSRKKDLDEELHEEFECPECHHLVSDDDAVCAHCGAEFEDQAYKCPKCGSMLDPEDEECSECGYDFEDQEKMELEDDEDTDEDMELDEDTDEDMDLDDEEDDLEEVEEEDED